MGPPSKDLDPPLQTPCSQVAAAGASYPERCRVAHNPADIYSTLIFITLNDIPALRLAGEAASSSSGAVSVRTLHFPAATVATVETVADFCGFPPLPPPKNWWQRWQRFRWWQPAASYPQLSAAIPLGGSEWRDHRQPSRKPSDGCHGLWPIRPARLPGSHHRSRPDAPSGIGRFGHTWASPKPR